MVTTHRFAFLRAFIFSFFVALAASLPLAYGQETGSDFTIDLAVVENRMAFDQTAFTVAAGSRVTVRFKNNDGMIHNFILARKSGGEAVYMEIAQATIDLGSRAFELDFVPEGDLVLAHSKLLQPGDSATITFTAPSETGPYPYVCTIFGHARTMNGIMHVTADGKPPEAKTTSGFSELHYRYYEGE